MKITTIVKRFDRGAAAELCVLPTSRRAPFLLILLLVSLPALVGRAAELAATPSGPDFGNMSLDQLMNYPVTSPTKHEGKLSEAPAAIEVITQEDIRRSGVTSIPEALRMAPGLDVAKVDAHTWAISSRGFNDVFANKLLVLQDGRSIYTPLFSGVFWDVQDTLLEDIDRIEVIRGPGAALWGANAVNGVINIITKKASDTQGLLISGGAGSEERGFGGLRYGGKFSENLYFRVYGKYFDRDDSVFANGATALDAWHMGREGFRLDWEASAENLVTLQGDFYSGTANQIFTNATPTPPFIESVRDQIELSGGNVLGRTRDQLGQLTGRQPHRGLGGLGGAVPLGRPVSAFVEVSAVQVGALLGEEPTGRGVHSGLLGRAAEVLVARRSRVRPRATRQRRPGWTCPRRSRR